MCVRNEEKVQEILDWQVIGTIVSAPTRPPTSPSLAQVKIPHIHTQNAITNDTTAATTTAAAAMTAPFYGSTCGTPFTSAGNCLTTPPFPPPQRDNAKNGDRVFFCADDDLQYFPFCADFGPMNFGMTFRFICALRATMDQARVQGKKVVVYTMADAASRTNAVMLLILYLVLEMGYTAEEACLPFTFIGRDPFLPFRDASFQPVTFGLNFVDIAMGVQKAKVSLPPPPPLSLSCHTPLRLHWLLHLFLRTAPFVQLPAPALHTGGWGGCRPPLCPKHRVSGWPDPVATTRIPGAKHD